MGPEFGTFLHEVFEKIDLQKAGSATKQEMTSLCSPFVKKSQYASFEEKIGELVFHAFHTPLPAGFCLKDVLPQKMSREMQFLYFTDNNALKGVMDLFFEHEGRYYLLDWKSNFLGNAQDDYAKECLEKQMRIHDYYLQEKIYRDGLQKYLALFDCRPFQEIFGGTFYVFLRGLPDNGVIHVRDC